ncbi:hypothetical protein BGZ93_009761 [Podila epicladia]|nr:hypothetical protein BGZ93_009761 [Podila epicladia]KAG0093835.1 hypothetical protein BGZ92_001076 [Podila epicladia]
MRTSAIVATTVGALAIATIGYVIYVDLKEKKTRKVRKARKAVQTLAQTPSTKSALTLEDALADIKDEDFPTSTDQREEFSWSQFAAAERFIAQGPDGYGVAAICLLKGLKCFPTPADFFMIVQMRILPEVFNILIVILRVDAQNKQEKYCNVKVKERKVGVAYEGQREMQTGLFAAKSFAAGETIYSEAPEISALEPSLEGKDYCHYCLKQIVPEESKVRCSKCTHVVFCTESCKTTAWEKFHSILCTKDMTPTAKASLQEYTKETRKLVPEMVARFLAKKAFVGMLSSGAPYYSFDYIDPLSSLLNLEVSKTAEEEKEIELLRATLGSSVPGFAEFLTDEGYLAMKGRLLFNNYGISTCLDADREIQSLPEIQRCVLDGSITGAGFYRLTSYLFHSCEPNTKLLFSEKDHRVSVVAMTEIKTGEELVVSYIKNGHLSTEERRLELFSKYRIRCMCCLCEPLSRP